MKNLLPVSLLLLLLVAGMVPAWGTVLVNPVLAIDNATVVETAPIGTVVGTVSLLGGGGYLLNPNVTRWPDNAAFTLDKASGVLTTNQTFDYNVKHSYTIDVLAKTGSIVCEKSFVITVIKAYVDAAPAIDQIADLTLNENDPAVTLPLSVTSPDSDGTLAVAANAGTGIVTVDISDDLQSLIVTPVPETYGTDTVTITAYSTNNVGVSPPAMMSFNVTVNFVKDAPPTIGSLSDLTVFTNSGAHDVTLSDITTADADDTVAVTATSDNPALIPDPTIAYAAPNSTGTLTFTPATDAFGVALITVTVTASAGTPDEDTASTTFTVTVIAKPTATKQFLATKHDTPINITLAGTDPQGLPLGYTIVDTPAHGTLSGTAPALTFTPEAGYIGVDHFTFTVNNGYLTSDPAKVYVTMVGVPAAIGNTLTTKLNTPVNITLVGTDPVDMPLTAYYLKSQPAHGSLTYFGTSTTPALGKLITENLVYTPATGFIGVDSFTFSVTNGFFTSADARISITVYGVPAAIGNTLVTKLATPVSFTLTGTDPLGQPINSFALVTGPAYGALTYTATGLPAGVGTLTSPGLTFTPAAGFRGVDTLTFTVTNSAGLTSNVATVSFTVVGQPKAGITTITTNQNTPLTYTLTGSDPLGLPLTGYTLTALPAHGTLTYAATGLPVALGLMTGLPPVVVYTPNPGFHDQDSFSFTVTNGYLTSDPAKVSITVFGKPTAYAKSATTSGGVPVALTLTGTDLLGLPVTYNIAIGPVHGTLTYTATGLPVTVGPSLTSPNVTFTPTPGFVGTDTFTYTVYNGHIVSNPATVTITSK